MEIDPAYHGQTDHAMDINKKETTNAFLKHLDLLQPDQALDKSVI